jgi:hypothetical protein
MNTLQERRDALMGSACPKKASDADKATHSGLFVWITLVREEVKP